jgi:acyl-CoA thioester hydrolase
MPRNGTHETRIRVRYKDTDCMGVVYYGNYLTYFEAARTEFMRGLGMPYSELEARGFYLMVAEAQARYRANVGYDSLVTVHTRIAEARGARVRFEYEVTGEDGRVLVTGYTVHACVDGDGKVVRLPAELIKILEEEK